jgi:hypothetical protein
LSYYGEILVILFGGVMGEMVLYGGVMGWKNWGKCWVMGMDLGEIAFE